MLKKSRRVQMLVVAVLGISLLGASSALCAWNFVVPAKEVRPVNGVFAFPANSFADGKAQYFVYKHSSSQWIRFFVVKSVDGVIRAAFDSCDVCYQHKKGYVQQGSFMVCRNCGLKFRTDKVNEVHGGCNPAGVKRTIQGDKIVIAQADMLNGIRFFQ